MARTVLPLPAALLISSVICSAASAQTPCSPGNLFLPLISVPMGAYTVEVAAADFDGDGPLDFASANYLGNSVSVRLNRPEGFVPMPPLVVNAPTNLIAADFNEDGFSDLAVTTFQPGVRILLGAGDGTFPNGSFHAVLPEPRGLAAGDFNEDGITDLAVASNQGMCVLIGLGSNGVGNGSFATRVDYGAPGVWGVTTADVNSDGITDLVAVGMQSTVVTILRGLGAGGVGNGTFDAAYTIPGVGNQRELVAEDFNEDGIVDLATAGTGFHVLIGQGAGGIGNGQFSLTPYFTGRAFNGVTCADFDRDGHLDLATTEPPPRWVVFMRGQGDGLFAGGEFYPCEDAPIGVTHADLTGDGGLELLVANSGSGNVSILRSTCNEPPPGPPVITGFTPAGGIVGTAVTIMGARFEDVTLVEFHDGVQAVIVSTEPDRIETIVPPGAVTGPIRVTSPQGSAISTQSFFVADAPLVTDAQPRAGKRGTRVVISGEHFTGATGVFFGATSPAPFTLDSGQQITAIVDAGAISGPIRVATPAGEGSSTFDFTVIPLDTVPRIAAVRDVPNDQGGRIALEWLRSDLDDPDIRSVTGYRVWRRAPLVATSGSGVEPMQTIETGPDGELTAVFWEALATLPAAFLEGYAYIAPTTQDSMETGNPYSAFFVQALTSDPFVFYPSSVDSGYSVDNLSPASPSSFAAVYQPAGGVRLHWGTSREADLLGYRLHRGTFRAFVPGPDNLLSAQPDTGHFDPQGSMAHFYKLAAVDEHGNRSLYALTSADAVSTLASLVGVEAEPDRIEIRWDLSANPGLPATIYRRVGAMSWTRLTSAVADGAGRLVYEDTEVAPGGRHGYRLGIMDAGVEVFAGEGWVDVPAFASGISSVYPNPAAGPFEVRFMLAYGAPATLELLDISGRRVIGRDVGGSAGRQAARIDPPSALPAGLYLVRLTQGGTRATAKIAIVK